MLLLANRCTDRYGNQHVQQAFPKQLSNVYQTRYDHNV
jgi:hypothetical protein